MSTRGYTLTNSDDLQLESESFLSANRPSDPPSSPSPSPPPSNSLSSDFDDVDRLNNAEWRRLSYSFPEPTLPKTPEAVPDVNPYTQTDTSRQRGELIVARHIRKGHVLRYYWGSPGPRLEELTKKEADQRFPPFDLKDLKSSEIWQHSSRTSPTKRDEGRETSKFEQPESILAQDNENPLDDLMAGRAIAVGPSQRVRLRNAKPRTLSKSGIHKRPRQIFGLLTEVSSGEAIFLIKHQDMGRGERELDRA